MRMKAFIVYGLLFVSLISCNAPKTVDPVGNSKRLPVGRDKSVDRDTLGAGNADTSVTDTTRRVLEPNRINK